MDREGSGVQVWLVLVVAALATVQGLVLLVWRPGGIALAAVVIAMVFGDAVLIRWMGSRMA